MAIVDLAAPFQSFSGALGNMVLYNIDGREYARARVKPFNPDTEAQRGVRRAFGDAVRAWQQLSVEEKGKWRRLARKLHARGYNLFISRYLRLNIGSATRSLEGNRCLPQVMRTDPSVSTALNLSSSHYPRPIGGKSGLYGG